MKISIRIPQEHYNFLCDLFPNTRLSEAIRFAIQMLEVLVDRGFYCKLTDCPNLSDKPLLREATDNGITQEGVNNEKVRNQESR